MTLQPGTAIQQVHQHKWPLRPGVQVHVNGTNSLTLAVSGSVLLSPADQAETNNSDSTGSPAHQSRSHRTVDCQIVETGNPHYETLRDKKRRRGEDKDSGGGSQMTDSGSESTRSVICVKGPCRLKPPIPMGHELATEADRTNTSGRSLTPLTPQSHLITRK